MTAETRLPVATGPTDEDETSRRVVRAQAGDRDAFGRLVEDHWHELVALARAILADDREAEDTAQEALIHAWSRLGSLRRPEAFRSWLRRAVARRCLSRARRRRNEEPAVDELAGPTRDSGARLEVRRLLRRLSPRQRAAVYLTWIEGLTDREAARELGMAAATVRVHRHRGLQHLRRTVEETS